ncbi:MULTISPECIES: hypothetical protein [Vibrio]|uniref:hypothetical protein n=1 Tax=Vibrio TaxID=662 RepID=UPI0004256DF2|nr:MULTISPECIES: hypothetical protein [Vibrio]AXT74195.1 hypothetical protein DBX26_24800 [Vibrio sp. dhg]EJM7154702.1 hypothetical protein [Vibrio parahaemolyticus]EJS2611057.1 hypothetical protein [Vibrio alginolyticus]MCA2452334.1 hypothetical protein [Vibrio alginolyticus]MCA2476360.1 hypothetical protein [Vibrio alginolyticus]
MELNFFIIANVNNMVRDWIDELRLFKYTNDSCSDFLVDVIATKEMNGELDELLTLINANCTESYTLNELDNCQYVHVHVIN